MYFGGDWRLCEPLVHHGAERELVDQAAVGADDRDDPAMPAGHDRLACGDRAVGLQHQGLLRAVVEVAGPGMCASMPTASMQASGPRPPVISISVS